jgi:hypothetical protein
MARRQSNDKEKRKTSLITYMEISRNGLPRENGMPQKQDVDAHQNPSKKNSKKPLVFSEAKSEDGIVELQEMLQEEVVELERCIKEANDDDIKPRKGFFKFWKENIVGPKGGPTEKELRPEIIKKQKVLGEINMGNNSAARNYLVLEISQGIDAISAAETTLSGRPLDKIYAEVGKKINILKKIDPKQTKILEEKYFWLKYIS